MKSFNKKIQKTILIILLVGLTFSTTVFYNPKKVNAGFADDFANIGLFVKETVLDGIAYAVGNVVVSNLSRQAVDYIKSGFRLPDGRENADFFSQPSKFIEQSVDQGIGQFLQKEVPFLCSPFGIEIETALGLKYKGDDERRICTYSQVTDNIDNAFTRFSNDFDQGGWRRWVDFTVNPRNNPQGAFLEADAKLGVKVGSIKSGIEADLLQGGGFLSLKETVCDERAFPLFVFNDDGSTNWEHSIWVDADETFVADMKEGDRLEDAPCITEERTIIRTPGQFLSKQLTESIGISGDRLGIADEIDEVVGVLITQLVQTGFDHLGLFDGELSGSEGDSSFKRISKTLANFKDELGDNIKEYLTIKKESLEVNGGFSTDDGFIVEGTQENIKIDWLNRDFEWEEKKYYGQATSSIDWQNKLFNWEYNKYYSKNIKQEIYEVKCTNPDNAGNLSHTVQNIGGLDKWLTAACTDIKLEDGTRIETTWVIDLDDSKNPLNPIDAFTQTAGDELICDQNNKNKTGYFVEKELDEFWKTATCSLSSSNYVWTNILTTSDETNRKNEVELIEVTVDWLGLAFDWQTPTEEKPYLGIYTTDRRMMMPNSSADTNTVTYTSDYDRFDGFRIENREAWAGNRLNEEKQAGSRASFTPEGFMSGNKSCWPKDVGGLLVFIINDDGFWEKYECSEGFNRQFNFEEFGNKIADSDGGDAAARLGVWKRVEVLNPAKLKIFLSSGEAVELLNKYGSLTVVESFEDLQQCLLDKSGNTNEIEAKIKERKKNRVQLLVDILYAQEVLDKVNELENTLSNFLNGSDANELNYTNFAKLITSINTTAGFDDTDIEDAKAERDRLISENENIENELRSCEK